MFLGAEKEVDPTFACASGQGCLAYNHMLHFLKDCAVAVGIRKDLFEPL